MKKQTKIINKKRDYSTFVQLVSTPKKTSIYYVYASVNTAIGICIMCSNDFRLYYIMDRPADFVGTEKYSNEFTQKVFS